MPGPAFLLAHAGAFSWDEALLVMAPLLAVAGLLWRANRRAARLGDEPARGRAAATPPADTPDEPTR